ncbi:MAG TPA: hypothetical protein PKD61_01205 [Polyangiaceae bacterium]|nr:hypothetical protein [Polyangiaceae bacterium]
MDAENFESQICACVPDAAVEICGDGKDNECNGRVDDCMVCDGAAVPQDDPKHCGGCNVACRADQVCVLAACTCPQQTPFECDGKCASFDSDPQNCGACGTSCQSGQACVNGVCSCTDSLTPDYCSGAGCVDLSTNDENCGACGNACPVGQSCMASTCQCPSPTVQEHCPGVGCVDLDADASNCGTCGNVCPSGASCFNGTCSCPAGQKDTCANTCVDLQGDEQNCGSCGTSCVSTQQCLAGTCTCLGGSLCNGVCTNTTVDKQNCGTCGNVCSAGQNCVSGTCACPTSVPSLCDGVCVNTQTNSSHCGACNAGCPSGQVCSSGTCKCYVSGQTLCAAGCTDTKTDTQNCGACGNVCPAAQSCSNGACTCGTGKTWCAATSTCVTTSSDPANCGTCGKTCETGQICSAGTCRCPNYNEQWCASTSACTDVYSNATHCGACDKACPANTYCSYASCRCNQANQTLCGTTCHDLQTDATHCGSCTKACSGNQICSAGKCMCPNPIVGSALRLTTTATKTLGAAAAWNGTHAGVVYEEIGTTGELYFALLNADGTRAKSPDVQIASGQTAGSLTPDIAWTGTEFGVAWANGYSSIMFRRLTADGTPKAGMVDITAATPGTKAPISAPRITWSPVYGGYAIVTLGYTGTSFQRIGTDGTAPEAVNVTATGSAYGRAGMALSPAGEWAIAVRYSNSTLLAFYNSDGSKTKPVSTLDSWTYYNDVPVVVHDGSTWVTTYVRNDGDVMVNRGASVNTPASVLKLPSNVYPKAFRTIVSSGGAYDFVELRDNLIRHQRFSLSQTGGTTVTPLTSASLVLSTPNALGLEALAVGSGKQLVLWSDNRWGAEELYAAPVNLQNCP